MKLSIRNATRDTALGDAVEKADSAASRRTGLLKHTSLAEGAGLWLVPCRAIHMFFMRFPIDAVYIDKQRRVRKAVAHLKPGAMSMCLTAHSVIELPAGTIERSRTEIGDQLEMVPAART